jgi:hypothetical protein
VALTVDCTDGHEEAIAWIESERLRRDYLIITLGNYNAVTIEVFADRPGCYDKVIDIPILRPGEARYDTLQRVAAGAEVLWRVGSARKTCRDRPNDLRYGSGVGWSDELD